LKLKNDDRLEGPHFGVEFGPKFFSNFVPLPGRTGKARLDLQLGPNEDAKCSPSKTYEPRNTKI